MSSEELRKGDSVWWRWASGTAEGTIVAVHTERVERTIKGKRIVRNGTPENPALEIEQGSGAAVLKLASEVQLD